MHFSALLVQCAPNALAACIRDLEALPGVEVHYSEPLSNRVVAVQESESLEEQKEGLRRIQCLPSVLMAQLVYHYHYQETGSENAHSEVVETELPGRVE